MGANSSLEQSLRIANSMSPIEFLLRQILIDQGKKCVYFVTFQREAATSPGAHVAWYRMSDKTWGVHTYNHDYPGLHNGSYDLTEFKAIHEVWRRAGIKGET